MITRRKYRLKEPEADNVENEGDSNNVRRQIKEKDVLDRQKGSEHSTPLAPLQRLPSQNTPPTVAQHNLAQKHKPPHARQRVLTGTCINTVCRECLFTDLSSLCSRSSLLTIYPAPGLLCSKS